MLRRTSRPIMSAVLVAAFAAGVVLVPGLATHRAEAQCAAQAQARKLSRTPGNHIIDNQLTSQGAEKHKVRLPDGPATEYRLTHSGEDHGEADAETPPYHGSGDQDWWTESFIAILHRETPIVLCDETYYEQTYTMRFSLWSWRGDFDGMADDLGAHTDFTVYAGLQKSSLTEGWTKAGAWYSYSKQKSFTCVQTAQPTWAVIPDQPGVFLRALVNVLPRYYYQMMYLGQMRWFAVPGYVRRETASHTLDLNASNHNPWVGVLTGTFSGSVPTPGMGPYLGGSC
jgi:hypothetical protein